MKAKERCISKWEKKLTVAKRINEKYKDIWNVRQRTDSNILLIEEILKDLKRL